MSQPADLTETFFLAWVNACVRLDVDPIDMAKVCYSESGMSASAHNPHGDASGIFQAMPDTLSGLGWTKGHAAFRALPPEDQIPFLERYFRPHAFRMGVGGQQSSQLRTAAHVYTVNFLPARLGAVVAAGDKWRSVVLCGGGLLDWAYAANKVLDRDGDGRITAGDLADHLDKVCRGSRWDAIVHRIQRARGMAPPSIPPPANTEPDPTTSLRRSWDLSTVRGVQARLLELGFDPGPIDGMYGPRTRAAVIAFQTARSLRPDGIAGPLTRTALTRG